MGIKGVVLENHGNIAVFGSNAIDDPIANGNITFGQFLQARYHTQAGTLAAARWADQHQELFVLDIQVDVMNNLDLTETLVDVVKFDTCHYRYSFSLLQQVRLPSSAHCCSSTIYELRLMSTLQLIIPVGSQRDLFTSCCRYLKTEKPENKRYE